MVSTMMYLRAEKFALCLEVAEILLKQQITLDPKLERGGREWWELTNKVVGWLMRELGKRRIDLLRDFLKKYAKIMPRTMLRYMLEKMSRAERTKWLQAKSWNLQAKKKLKRQKLEKQKIEESKEFIFAFEKTLSVLQKKILQKLRLYFDAVDVKEVWQWNTIVWKLPNKTWWYINMNKRDDVVLWYGARKRLEEINPMIVGLRDEALKVVGKIVLSSEKDLEKKGIEVLIKMSGEMNCKI